MKGHLYVVPADVAAQLSNGKLDRRLFDVTGLIEAGYDDKASSVIPLVVTYSGKGKRAAGVTVSRELPVLNGAAVKLAKKNAGTFLHRNRSAGVEKIWLDGKRRPTLPGSRARRSSTKPAARTGNASTQPSWLRRPLGPFGRHFGEVETSGLPAEEAEYKLVASMTRPSISKLSSWIDYSWTFRSGATAKETPLPIMGVRYEPKVDARNVVKRTPVTSLPVTVLAQPGTEAPNSGRPSSGCRVTAAGPGGRLRWYRPDLASTRRCSGRRPVRLFRCRRSWSIARATSPSRRLSTGITSGSPGSNNITHGDSAVSGVRRKRPAWTLGWMT